MECFNKVEKEYWLKKIRKDKYMFKNLPVILMEDKKFIHNCIKLIFPNLLIYTSKYASKNFKLNMPFLIECIEIHPEILKYLPYNLQENKEFIFKCFQKIYYSLEYASNKLKNDKEFILKCIKYSPISLQYASNKLIDKDFILYIIKKNIYDPTYMYCILELLPDIFKNDHDIIYKAIKKNPDNFKYISSELKDNKEIAQLALKENIYLLKLVSERLRGNKEFILDVIKNIKNIDKHYYNGVILKYLSYTLQNDFEVVFNAVSKSANELLDTTYEFQDNEIIIEAAISDAELKIKEKYTSRYAKYISDRLRNNFDIMLKVVSIYLNDFEYVSTSLKNNIDFINSLVNCESINFVITTDLYIYMRYILINKQIILNIIGKKNIYSQHIPWDFIPTKYNRDKDIILHYGRKYKHLHLDSSFQAMYNTIINSIEPLNNYIQINDLPSVVYTINNDGSILNIAGELIYTITDSNMTFSQLSDILYSIKNKYMSFTNIEGNTITPFDGYRKITEVYTHVKLL